jgi:hypothetical protein
MTEFLHVESQRLTFISELQRLHKKRQQHNNAFNKSEIFFDKNKKVDKRNHDHNLS